MKLKNLSLILLIFCSTQTFAQVAYTKLAHIKLVDQGTYPKKNETLSDVEDLIEEKKFQEISKKAQQLLNSEEYNYDGKFKHTSYLDYFLGIVNKYKVTSPNYFKDNIVIARQWFQTEPESPLGYIYYALWIRKQAWSVRGGDYTSQISEKNLQYFSDQSIKNLNFLMENYEVASKDPFYYYVVLMILRDLGLEEDYLKAYQDGIAKYPKHRVIYNTFMESFQPKWFGENYDAIKMIVDDIQRLNPKEKNFYYYHIMYTANRNNYDLRELKVNWNRVEQGAVDSLSKLASLSKINDIKELYCSYPGNKKRLEKLFNAFKDGQLDPNYVQISIDSCQE
ncbi:hypothetical protein [Acinetobacter sp. WC-323]|uniref:hypothetical protein n=1 Tax=Acinetobacter sp. WC-323 TaxID=903918 RepID=UPI00051849AC|nr:hypothetical protein [Acinetobacter sp. WC-323]